MGFMWYEMDSCNSKCEALSEVVRLRVLVAQQQKLIEYLRQGLKERERKLDQFANRRKKENFYRQWLELEPVAEVTDEEEQDESDSQLCTVLPTQSSRTNTHGIIHQTYGTLLMEVDKLHVKYVGLQQELVHAKSQVRDLEKALLQETRGSQNSRRALSDKLCEVEEREVSLLAEISELKEQNELLEFRVLELEESEPRESPDTADSGVVSPEPHSILYRDHGNSNHRGRYNPYKSYDNSLCPIVTQTSSLSIQEREIFDEDDDHEVISANSDTQTEIPTGELLQEVQRLQEFRERIQERTVKVPMTPTETYEIVEDNRVLLYKNKICELETQLCKFAVAAKKQSHDQLIMKQREEDLLDENYRLTEKIYLLTSELRKCHNLKKYIDIGTMTDLNLCESSSSLNVTISKYENHDSIINIISSLSHCQNNIRKILQILKIPIFNSNSNEMVNNLKNSTKLCSSNNAFRAYFSCNILRQNYEKKIHLLTDVFALAFKQVNATWLKFDADNALGLRTIEKELSVKALLNQTMIIRIYEGDICFYDRLRFSQLPNCTKINVRHNTVYDGDTSKSLILLQKKRQTEKPENIENNIKTITNDHVDCKTVDYVLDNSSEEFKKFSEGRQTCDISWASVHYEESSSDTYRMRNKLYVKQKIKKQRWINDIYHNESAMRGYKTSGHGKNYVKSIIDLRRLVLYPEICV